MAASLSHDLSCLPLVWPWLVLAFVLVLVLLLALPAGAGAGRGNTGWLARGRAQAGDAFTVSVLLRACWCADVCQGHVLCALVCIRLCM